MQQAWGRVKLTEVNPHLVCVLCHGYFIDATTMAECPHSFCRSCIILYLETKSYCPICEVQIHKTKPHLNLKPDKTLQDIVYKLVPGLFHSEMRRRREFYIKHPNHDLYLNPEARGVGVERIIYSPEDSISLSVEYYDDEREREEWTSTQPGHKDIEKKSSNRKNDDLKRYLQCPAVVTMSQIKKFIRMKYNLAASCTVEILYRRESLPDSYSLMDVAYIYTWKRNGPMRFYYRIHVSVPFTQPLPALESSSVVKAIEDNTQTEIKLNNPNVDKDTKSVLCSVEATTISKTNEQIKETDVEHQTKNESNSAIARPYASEHDELSVSLLLSLSNGHHSTNAVPSIGLETVEKHSENSGTNSTSTPDTSNRSSVSQISNTVESKVDTVPPPLISRNSVNGYSQNSIKNNKCLVNGPTKPTVKKIQTKCFAKPSVKSNVCVKSNEQCTNNIVSTKLMDNGNKTPSKTVQNFNIPNCNTVSSKDQIKSSEEKKILENNPSNTHSTASQAASLKQFSAAETLLKSTKYLQSSKKTDTMNPQNMDTKSEKISAVNNAPTEYKTLSNTDNKTFMKCNNQDKNETKSIQIMSNNVQPIHRKEVNRLEQIVKNCMKNGKNLLLNKSIENSSSNGETAKTETREGSIKKVGQNTCISKGLPSSGVNNSSKETMTHKEVDQNKEESSILKRKLKDPMCLISVNRDNPNLLGPPDAKKRRLVTPDVSIELTTHPSHENKKNPMKRPAECSDLSILTKRFLDSIQQMKKHTSTSQEFNIKDIDQLCASNVKIEKISSNLLNSSSNKSPSSPVVKSDDKDKISSDNTNVEKHNHKKKDDLISIAIERINENLRMTEKSNDDQTDSMEMQEKQETFINESVPSTSATKESLPSPSSLKKLPRLIEINAPPRPKLPMSLQDQKQRTGLKMTTVRKEVPIGKEGPLGRKDNTGALDLSSGSPGFPKNKLATNPRPGPAGPSKSPSLSPLQAMSSFQVPEVKSSPPLRIPNLKHKTSPHLQPRPSSLSSSSPSPPADSRTSEMFSSAAFQQLYRHQLELQSRLMASSQVNNNKWRQDPLSAKKFEEWMRNMINCGGLPPHPLMFQSQLGSSSDTVRK